MPLGWSEWHLVAPLQGQNEVTAQVSTYKLRQPCLRARFAAPRGSDDSGNVPIPRRYLPLCRRRRRGLRAEGAGEVGRSLAASGLALLVALAAASCVHVPQTGFDQQTANAVARDPMRTMRTNRLDVSYPAAHRDAALEVAQALDRCVERIYRAMPPDHNEGRFNVLVTSANCNNAFVSPAGSSARTQMLLPLSFSLEVMQKDYNLGVRDVATVACHEAVHYAIFQQVKGLGGAWRQALGNPFVSVDTLSVERWFHEGLAVWLESDHQHSRGRLASPTFKGRMEAFVASRPGTLRYETLSEHDRQSYPAGSGAYLVGAHFVAYLAATYGEDKLWQAVDRQGESFFSALLFANRLQQVYGASPTQLFARFMASIETTARSRRRPANQTTLTARIGPSARIAACPWQGLVAVVDEDLDRLTTVSVLRQDGSQLWRERLSKIGPSGGPWASSAQAVSGLSFSGDCQRLLVAGAHPDAQGTTTTTLYEADAQSGRWLRQWPELRGIGGGVDPAGERYAFVRIDRDRTSLAIRHLATGTDTMLPATAGGTSLGSPVFSPDGQRLAFAARTEAGFNIMVYDEAGTVRALTADGAFNYGPRWLDNTRIAFVRGIGGRAQAAEVGLAGGEPRALTDAPHAVADPSPAGAGRLIFLNAHGLGWTLDRVVPVAEPSTEGSSAASTSAAPAAGTAGTEAGPAAAPLAPLDDRPYRSVGALGWPTARVPYLSNSSGGGIGWRAGLRLAGQDPLGYHGYSASLGYVELTGRPEGHVAYVNKALSPLSFAALASTGSSPSARASRGQLTATRRWQWITGQMGLLGYTQRQAVLLDMGQDTGTTVATFRRRAVGASLGWTVQRTLATPYGGPRKRLYGGLLVVPTFGGAGWARATTAVRAELSAVVPAPYSRRQSIALGLQGWAAMGDPTGRIYLGRNPALTAGIIAEQHALSFDGANMPAVASRASRQLAILQGDYRIRTVIDRGIGPTVASPPLFLSGLLWRGFGAIVATRHAQAAARLNRRSAQPLAGADVSILFNVYALPIRLTVGAAHAFYPRGWQRMLTIGAGEGDLWPQAPSLGP